MLLAIFVLSGLMLGQGAKASSDHEGKIVKMNGLSTLYYVGSDGKRYVFPSSKIYHSWFTSFDDVSTLTESELTSLPLGGNVLYRPGVLLIKITTDPKVYAVTKGGVLRWITTEAIARNLYGDKWSLLVDDMPDSFFTNYTIGAAVSSVSDFDPEDETDSVEDIDTNRGRQHRKGLKAKTRKCQIISNARYCTGNNNNSSHNDDLDEDNEDYDDDGEYPEIDKITISNSGGAGYIGAGDKITVNFSEAIDPKSVHSDLEVDDYVNSLENDITGSIHVFEDGVIEIKNIAKFDLGAVEDTEQFAVKMELSSSAKTLTLTILSGSDVRIEDEDFEDAEQIAGTIKDMTGNAMQADDDIGKPSGSFGGENVNDGIEPYITGIRVNNKGDEDYIDVDDEIKITFSEAIDPESVHEDLDEDKTVYDVDADDTGGVEVSRQGVLKVNGIASFFVGDVDDSGEFNVNLNLNSTGKILTVTLASGDDIALDDEDLDDAEQIGDTIEDKDGNDMEDDPNIKDPTGTFVGDSLGSDLYIDFVKAYDDGYAGYLDIDDRLVITFSEAIDEESINEGYVEYDETGGFRVDANGIVTITDIMSFDMGEVEEARNFEAQVTLSSNDKVMTIKLVDGDAVKIEQEVFSDASQTGGYLINKEDSAIVMDSRSEIDAPEGTFGGESNGTAPYIIEIDVENGDDSDYIDEGDSITITFSEAIDPDSIDNSLDYDDKIDDVDDDDTGGVTVKDNGILGVTDICEFSVGGVDDDGEFDVEIELNEIGNILTITLESGQPIEITYEDLDDAEQLGGTIEDEDGNEMEDDPRIDDPSGSF